MRTVTNRMSGILCLSALALGALCLCGAGGPAPKGKKAVPPSSRYVLDIPNTKMGFAVYVNGWLIDHNPGGKVGYFSSSRLGSAVADGQNTVILYVDNPKVAPPPQDRCEVRIRSEAGEAFHYDWEPGDPKRPLPFEAKGHFTAHLPHGPYTWQRGSTVAIGAKEKEGLNALIVRVESALEARNVGETTALFQAQVRDGGLARGLTASEAAAENRAEWVKSFADPHWRRDPIDFAHLTYAVIADGRAVEVRRADGGLVFRAAAPPHEGYDVVFCLVDGRWTLIGPSGS
jgi:hypothetical protein